MTDVYFKKDLPPELVVELDKLHSFSAEPSFNTYPVRSLICHGDYKRRAVLFNIQASRTIYDRAEFERAKEMLNFGGPPPSGDNVYGARTFDYRDRGHQALYQIVFYADLIIIERTQFQLMPQIF